jgi:probable HAF family extracellular repeat protein
LAGSELANLQGALNNHGQVVGGSTLAGDLISHPFLWTKPGPMQDLGTFGGSCGTALAINDAGEVVGYSCTPGDQQVHAFMWTQDAGMTDLGTLDGDAASFAAEINSKGQIVGTSSGFNFIFVRHAVLWQDSQIIDLNTVIPPNSALHLTDAFAINDRGEIAGVGVPSGCSADRFCRHAFVLIPCGEGEEGCRDNAGDTAGATPTSPASVTQRITATTPANPALSGRGMLDRLRCPTFPLVSGSRSRNRADELMAAKTSPKGMNTNSRGQRPGQRPRYGFNPMPLTLKGSYTLVVRC